MKMVISSVDNPKVKLYKKLAASKKYRDQTGLFVVEGMRGCVDIASSCTEGGLVEIAAVFYTEEAAEKYRGLLRVELLEQFDSDKRFVITSQIAEKMSDVGKTQGAFVIAKKPDRRLSREQLSPIGKYLVLNNLQDPGNLGTMLRAGDAMGIDGIILTNNTADLYNPKVVRAAMGSIPRVKLYVENDFKQVIKLLNECKIKTCAAVVHGGETIRAFDFSGGCAAVIGNEGRGLSPEDVSLCSHKVTIEMRGNMDSLNAAVAAAIFLWEMFR